ncbi:MAG: TVP38/TMEM64 family protein [Acidimicrobiia bacterium]|nr:TVP38/TMEM64 family protein [Acidimicrobiia bacterium]
MDWLAPVVLRLQDLGPWGPVLFVLIYVVAAVVLAPAFFLTVAAGAMFGVWRGSIVVFVGASLGASAVYALASPLSGSALMQRVTRDPRVAAIKAAITSEALWLTFLLRLSPLIPYNILNYALVLSGVRYRDFALGFLGMIPAIFMYTYYGKVVGDVAALAAGVAPPRGPEYYAMVIVGLVAVVISTTMIARAARRAIARQQPVGPVTPR